MEKKRNNAPMRIVVLSEDIRLGRAQVERWRSNGDANIYEVGRDSRILGWLPRNGPCGILLFKPSPDSVKRWISSAYEHPKGAIILGLLNPNDFEGAWYLLRAGVHAIAEMQQQHDTRTPGELFEELRKGHGIFPGPTVRRAAEYIQRDYRAGSQMELLSQREREILARMTEGRENPQIAKELFISLATVKSHIKSIYQKLDCMGPSNSRRVKVVVTYLRGTNGGNASLKVGKR